MLPESSRMVNNSRSLILIKVRVYNASKCIELWKTSLIKLDVYDITILTIPGNLFDFGNTHIVPVMMFYP